VPYLRLADSPPSSGTRLHLRHRSVALLNAPLSTLFSTDINEVRLKLSEKFGATPLPPSTTADGVKLRKDLIMKAAPNGYCLLQLLSYYDRRLYSVSAADIVCIGIFIPEQGGCYCGGCWCVEPGQRGIERSAVWWTLRYFSRALTSCCSLSSVLSIRSVVVCNLQSIVPFSCAALLGMVHPKSQLSSVTGEQVSGARDDGYGSQVGIHCDRR